MASRRRVRLDRAVGAAALALLSSAIVLSSCGDEDDEHEGELRSGPVLGAESANRLIAPSTTSWSIDGGWRK